MLKFFHKTANNPLRVAYSRHGSYLSIIMRRGRLYFQSMYGGIWNDGNELFELTIIDHSGEVLPFEAGVQPDRIRLTTTVGILDICAVGQDTALIRGEGVGLRLFRSTEDRMFDFAFPMDTTRWEVTSFELAIRAGLRAQRGILKVHAPWDRIHTSDVRADFLPDEQGVVEGQIHLYKSAWREGALAPFDFEISAAENARDFAAWLHATPRVPERWDKARETASLIHWTSMVSPRGLLGRYTVLSSKDLMNRVWNWDQCFHVLAFAQQDEALAWDHFALFFDHQDEQGGLPDSLADTLCSFSFCKPPVHGWTLLRLMPAGFLTDERAREIYTPLSRWTDWWFTYRCNPGDIIPKYFHGNDSGWDNGTATADGLPVQSPDLCAYIILQMDVLAQIAERLGKPEESANWTNRADELLSRMIDYFWTGERFVPRHALTGAQVGGDSALMLIPLILGKRLPAEIRAQLVSEVRRFMTEHGVPSEHPNSPYFVPDGYWSGAIWAPTTYQIVDGLLACGERELALDISHRFCEMANRSGMSENFNPLTGDGLKDSAHTWTASVFLLLANMVLKAEG